ncbi:MAG: diguanylate cyclase [Gammaproteobacteria bacterium]
MYSALLARFSPSRLSVRARLGLIQLMLVGALAITSVVAWNTLNEERRLGYSLAVLSRAERHHLNADMMHDALHADVNASLRLTGQDTATAGKVLATLHEDSHRFTTEIDALQRLELPADVMRLVGSNRPRALGYLAASEKLVTTALSDHEAAIALEDSYNTLFDELLIQNDRLTAVFSDKVEQAEHELFLAEGAGKLWITVTGILTALIAWGFVAFIATSVRLSLRRVSDAARALAAGNLTVRSEIATQDEVGELAVSMNKMADDLQNMVDRLLADARRDAFSAQLIQALEMAENESDVRGVIALAMPKVSESLPMELFVADSNGTDLQQVAEHPRAGAPGCGVELASSCVAIRKGSPVVTPDSDALNACPRLRDRPCGSVSAVCVPVTFMGRSFGVLHAAGPARKPPSSQQVAQLATLGAQTGARLGTLRAFAHSHRQATTDGLTGLANRRAIQQIIQNLTSSHTSYAFALADLDQFKRLNDTHGHGAGDRALCIFSDVLKESVRDGDHVGRWGGEEFALVFPGTNAQRALEVIERVRGKLAEALLTSGATPFTASFGVVDAASTDMFADVLRAADEALYDSKHAGRDRATVKGMHEDAEGLKALHLY